MEAILQKFNVLVEWTDRFSMEGTRMIEIKSNVETAQELAASLKSSGDALSRVASASKDEQTKLSGNDTTHQAMRLLKPKQKKLYCGSKSISSATIWIAKQFTRFAITTKAQLITRNY